jgi:hypothetical protein
MDVFDIFTNRIYKTQLSEGGDDMALLFLPKDIPLEKGRIEAIKLAMQEPPMGLHGIQSGYGATLTSHFSDILRKGFTKLIPCSTVYPGIICSSGISDEGVVESTCQGDSGGPLVANGFLLGVLSSGVKGCKGLTVWCSVPLGREWIAKTLLENDMNIASLDGEQVVVPDDPSAATGYNEGDVVPQVRQVPLQFPGQCRGGVAPENHYPSGCRRSSMYSIKCVPHAEMVQPLKSMTFDMVMTMQKDMRLALDKKSDACCVGALDMFFCRAPKSGFAPNTPGALPEDIRTPGQEAPRVRPRQDGQ